MLKSALYILFLALFCISFQTGIAQNGLDKNGFIFSGEFFNDSDWGWSYKTSAQDRSILLNTHKTIQLAVDSFFINPGDYNIVQEDMSAQLIPEKQEESRKNGNKCPTCYYSQSPGFGHFQYIYTIRFDLIENSKTHLRQQKVADSLNILATDMQQRNLKMYNAEDVSKQASAEMEKFQKEIEKMDVSNLTEEQLAQIERKGKELDKMSQNAEKGYDVDKDTLHGMNGNIPAGKVDIMIKTNDALLLSDKKYFQSIKGNPGYYYRELQIPGCDFACIYFDLYNKSEKLKFSHNPVFVAYIGPIKQEISELPKTWVDPFCVKVTFAGDLQQIQEIYPKINFRELRKVAVH